MSVTITQHPSSFSFAGNPVLLKASSSLANKTFLKICAEITVSVYQQGAMLNTIARNLSIPTVGGNQSVVFDFSDVLQSALSEARIERNAVLAGGAPASAGGFARYSVKLWDEYLDEYQEVVSTKNSASVTSDNRMAIPGAYTDWQRLTKPEDTASVLGNAFRLSNKPDFEPIPVGGKVVVPLFSATDRVSAVYLDSEVSSNQIGTYNFYASEGAWKTLSVPLDAEQGMHSLLWKNVDVAPFFFYTIPEQPFATYFEFVNRMGAVESIYAYGRKEQRTALQTERQMQKHNTSFRPSARFLKRTLQETESIVMSTGPTNREWAKWFVSEFFTAEKAWMYSEETADMVPVVIECDEELPLFNDSEPTVLSLAFTVTKCING